MQRAVLSACKRTPKMPSPSSLVAAATLLHSALALSPPLVAKQLLETASNAAALRADRAFASILLFSDSECASAGWSAGALNMTRSRVAIDAGSCGASLGRCLGSAARWLKVDSCSDEGAAFVNGRLSARVGEYPTSSCSETAARVVHM